MSVIELNEQNFKDEVLDSATPVLVDFWASWCGPCKIMGPVIDELAKSWSGKPLKVAKLNVDEASGIAGSYQIMSIPTFLLYKEGKVSGQWRGVMDGKALEKEISALI